MSEPADHGQRQIARRPMSEEAKATAIVTNSLVGSTIREAGEEELELYTVFVCPAAVTVTGPSGAACNDEDADTVTVAGAVNPQ